MNIKHPLAVLIVASHARLALATNSVASRGRLWGAIVYNDWDYVSSIDQLSSAVNAFVSY
jgi:hypothetical protein